jgi:hypothetical protein
LELVRKSTIVELTKPKAATPKKGAWTGIVEKIVPCTATCL